VYTNPVNFHRWRPKQDRLSNYRVSGIPNSLETVTIETKNPSNRSKQWSIRMNLGKCVRLNRVFSHPSGRLCSIAVDHFIGYEEGLPPGLRDIRTTLAEICSAHPDAVTMHKGIAAALWEPYAGKLPLILQSSLVKLDDSAMEQSATVEDAVRLGADALAVVAFVRGKSEAQYLRVVADTVRAAAAYDLPVILHIYPRVFGEKVQISFAPADIAWAVRCAVEVGVDVVKTPYCGDVASYAQIVRECPIPLVAAGGPKAQSLEAALAMMSEVVQSGALGATIGRNVWGFNAVAAAVNAFKMVIHEGKSAGEALRSAGL
jgi:class I fructose-bisphosphate aldolase